MHLRYLVVASAATLQRPFVRSARVIMSAPEIQVQNPDDPGMGHGSFGWRVDEPTKFYSAPADILPTIVSRLAEENDGLVLECGSGSGQHMAALAPQRPKLRFQPSEHEGHPNPRANRKVETTKARSPYIANVLDATELTSSTVAAGLSAVIAINIIHVSPPVVMDGLISGAGTKLKPGGWLFFYGPFMRDGVITGEGNQKFQASLQALNPEYSLRDIAVIKAKGSSNGLELVEEVYHEASNNYLLCLQKQ